MEGCVGHDTSFGYDFTSDLGTGQSGLYSDKTDVTFDDFKAHASPAQTLYTRSTVGIVRDAMPGGGKLPAAGPLTPTMRGEGVFSFFDDDHMVQVDVKQNDGAEEFPRQGEVMHSLQPDPGRLWAGRVTASLFDVAAQLRCTRGRRSRADGHPDLGRSPRRRRTSTRRRSRAGGNPVSCCRVTSPLLDSRLRGNDERGDAVANPAAFSRRQVRSQKNTPEKSRTGLAALFKRASRAVMILDLAELGRPERRP